MRKVFLIAGIVLSTTAIFAQQIGIDNDEGWGKGRIILLGSGLAIILAGLLLILFQHKLSKLKWHISVFFNRYLNFSYFTQIIIVSFIVTITVLVGYTWFTQPNAKNSRNNYNYYSELARGFKLGNLYLAEKPSPALLSLSNPYDYFLRKQHKVEDFPWDVSLYNNRFYTYWGPAPSLILTIFNNKQLSLLGDHYVALAFACGLFLYAALIVGNFWHKSLQKAPVWLLGISLLTIGVAAPTATMLRESRIYEAAIFGCQFFFIGGCYWAYSSINNDRPVLWKLALAGFHWAFALGTRITILPVVFFTATATIIYIFKVYKTTTVITYLPVLAVIGTPLIFALAGLGWYNWARFGSIFEFGLKYQLANVDYSVFKDSFSSRHIPGNLFNYFVHPIQVLSRFPYIARIEYLPSNDRLAGLLYISPYLLLLFVPLIHMCNDFIFINKGTGAQQTMIPSGKWLIVIFTGSAFIAMMIILSFYYVTMRYIEDFMPSLILLITILLGWEYQLLSRSNILGKIVAVITISLASITITANILVAMPNSGKAYMIDLLNSISKLLGLK